MTMIVENDARVTGEYVSLDGESYYRIANCHRMDEFFMSVVGASDHWMFISSSGALTAGRCDPDTALFPYAADDQIVAARATTGSMTIIRDVTRQQQWEPFASRVLGSDRVRRNIYKTPLGNKLAFEETNDSFGLSFRYGWAFSEAFGFVRSCRLENIGSDFQTLELLDGLLNLLPYGLSSDFVVRFGNLGNAYKKSEVLAQSGVGLFYLSSIPSDRAEPCEGLRATTVWQTGLTPQVMLLSTEQLAEFRNGRSICSETDVRGKPGDADIINVCYLDGRKQSVPGIRLDATTSRKVFSRSGEIELIECHFASLR